MIATRSHVSASTDRSCVIRIIARPSSRRSSSSSSRICACIITSSAVVGSSPMISSGLQARASAIITRWRMPPENSCGYWRARAGADADVPEQLGDALVDALPVDRRARAAGSPRRSGRTRASRDRARSSRPGRPSRSCASAPAACRARCAGGSRRRPSRRVEDDLARGAVRGSCGSSPSSASAVVVLPQPDSPARPSASPRPSWNDDVLDEPDLAAVAAGRPTARSAHVEQRRRPAGRARARPRRRSPQRRSRSRGLTISSIA